MNASRPPFIPARSRLSRRTVLVAAASGAASVAVPAWSQGFPARPIKLICPWPAGGSTDIVMRAFADSATKALGDFPPADPQGDERVRHVQAGEVAHVAVAGGIGVKEDGLIGGNAHDAGKEVCLGERPHLLSGP